MASSGLSLEVDAIYPAPDGGRVRFAFVVPLTGERVTVELPYQATDPTSGVKEAAEYLEQLAEALADDAKAMRE